ncbi:LEA/WHy family protein [Flavitalea sp.]|nr:LEA type 2 family protein [Flavitalea sp.]
MKIGLLYVLVVVTLFACAKPKDLEYVDFKNLKVVKWGLIESTVGMDVEFFNPNKSNLQLKKADVDVFINNTYLGKSTLDSLVRIPGRDTFSLPVTMRVKTGGALTNILRIVSDSSVLIRMEGNASFGKGGVFLNYPIKYEGLKRIKF